MKFQTCLSLFACWLLSISLVQATDVSGTITYTKTVYSSSGSTSTTTTAVNGATVYAYDTSDTSTAISSTTTDSNGAYSFTGLSPSTVRITVATEGSGIKVGASASGSTINEVHESVVQSSTSGGSGVSVNISDETTAAAFNVFVQLLTGKNYLSNLSNPLTNSTTINAVFPSTTEGTQYKPTENYLVIQNYSGDPDGFDDDIILHEFGHWVAEQYSKDSSVGGAHTVTSQLDLRLSWSEGLAHYISSAIRSDAEHLDFNTAGTSQFNISSPGSATGTEVELSVASVLWNIGEARGHSDIFQALATFKSGLLSSISNDPISFDTFYDMWNDTFPSFDISTYTSDRSMSYFNDDNSSFSSSSPKVISSPDSFSQSSLTFFPDGNVDYFKFTPSSGSNYDISTGSLTNGALTTIKLYKGSLSNLQTEDTPSQNTGEGYIFLSGADNQEYFIAVSRFNSTSQNYGLGVNDGYSQTVGRYGTYTLTLAQTSRTTALEESSSSSSSSSSGGGGGGGGCFLNSNGAVKKTSLGECPFK